MLSSVSEETPGHCTPLHQCLKDRALPQSNSHKHQAQQPRSKRAQKLKKSALWKRQIIKGLHVLIVSNAFEVRSSKSGPPVPVLRDHEEHSLLLPFQSLRKHYRKYWPPGTPAREKNMTDMTPSQSFLCFSGAAFCISQNVSPCSFKFHEDWVADQWLSLNQDLFPIHPVGHALLHDEAAPITSTTQVSLWKVGSCGNTSNQLNTSAANQGAQCVALCTLAKLPYQAEPNDTVKL